MFYLRYFFPMKFEISGLKKGSIESDSLSMVLATASRVGNIMKDSLFCHINEAKTETLKIGCSTFKSLVINKRGICNSKVTIYDNILADGVIVAIIDLSDSVGLLKYNINLNNGLTYVTEGNDFDITLIYD